MPAVAEELRPQVKWGISRFEHDVVFLHHTQLAESCRGVEGNFGLTQNAPGQSVGDVVRLKSSTVPTQSSSGLVTLWIVRLVTPDIRQMFFEPNLCWRLRKASVGLHWLSCWVGWVSGRDKGPVDNTGDSAVVWERTAGLKSCLTVASRGWWVLYFSFQEFAIMSWNFPTHVLHRAVWNLDSICVHNGMQDIVLWKSFDDSQKFPAHICLNI